MHAFPASLGDPTILCSNRGVILSLAFMERAMPLFFLRQYAVVLRPVILSNCLSPLKPAEKQ
jgi:hypothetical protein